MSFPGAHTPDDSQSYSHSSRNRGSETIEDHSYFPIKRVIAITLLVFVFINIPTLLGSSSRAGDSGLYFAGIYGLVSDFAKDGRLLTWNPWINAGVPDGFEPQNGALSPVTVLISWITGPSELGFRVYWLTIWFGGGLGVLFLARHLRAPSWSAIVVALGILFSGLYFGQAQHLSHLYSFSLLPWAVWRLDVALFTKDRRSILEAGAFLGLSALGGYPGIALLNAMYLFAWSLGRFLMSNRSESSAPSAKKLLKISVGAYLVALLVASPLLIGFFGEVSGYSDRSAPIPYKYAVNNNAYSPGATVTAVNPFAQSIHLANRSSLWSYTPPSMCNIYAGALALVLGIGGLTIKKGSRFSFFLLIIGLLFLACAMGQTLPIRGWLYHILPPTQYFRHSAIFRDYFTFTVTVLALIGACKLSGDLKSVVPWRRFTTIAGPLGLLAIGSLYYLLSHFPVGSSSYGWWHLGLVWGSICGLCVVCSVQRNILLRRVAPYLLIGISVLDAFMTYQMCLFVRGNSKDRAHWDRMLSSHDEDLYDAHRNLTRLPRFPSKSKAWVNHNLYGKDPVLWGYSSTSNKKFNLFWESHILRKLALGSNRFWFASEPIECAPTYGAFNAWKTAAEETRRPTFLIHSRARVNQVEPYSEMDSCDTELPKLFTAQSIARPLGFRLISYTPNELSFSATAPSDGWILVTDRWARGWKCSINGEETSVWPGCFFFRAVKVVEGESTIRFRYRPLGHPWFVVMSWSLLLAIIIARAVPWVFTRLASRLRRSDHQ